MTEWWQIRPWQRLPGQAAAQTLQGNTYPLWVLPCQKRCCMASAELRHPNPARICMVAMPDSCVAALRDIQLRP